MKELILYNNTTFYSSVLNYIYYKYEHKINSFEYLAETVIKNFEYRNRHNETRIKMCSPCDTEFSFIFEKNDKCFEIYFKLETILQSNQNLEKIKQPVGCSTFEELILKKITLSSEENKEILIHFVDKSKKYTEEQIKSNKKSTEKTIKINYWRRDYWNLLSKSPKRSLDTLYLKENQKEEIIKRLSDFYDEKTKDEYLKYGIPYKNVFLLYGIPGSGKTSTINAIASHFDCDIYTIPISAELTDYGLIDAVSYLEDKEEKKRIIVIEDIDSIFTDRKKGDDINNITLQSLLNCFDGFSCVEGTLLFITANNPEILDHAMLRSCRIDHKFHLDYADKYQTKCIFENIYSDNKKSFDKFYKCIKNRKYTTAMLQEFLFYNRKCDKIIDKIDEFYEIIDKNNPENFEKNKKDKNLYM